MKRRWSITASTVVGVLSVVVVTAPSARAVVPGVNGRIVFSRDVWSSATVPETQIVASDANGANIHVLATYPRSAYDERLYTNWSPDGTKLIFTVHGAIWEMDADGGNAHELISCSSPGVYCPPDWGGFGEGPSFTPDGNSIIFEHCCTDGYGIYRTNADGTGLKPLKIVLEDVGIGKPQVSPNGKTIALAVCTDPGCYIATMNANGGNYRVVTDPAINANVPNWSPDSKKIVFQFFPDHPADSYANVGTINADGSGFATLTHNTPGAADLGPAFSPDGTKIVFARFRSTSWFDLFVMNADGSRAKELTYTGNYGELWPQWATG